jgi:hypothetical protein
VARSIDDLDLLWGANAIGEVLDISPRKAFYLLEKRQYGPSNSLIATSRSAAVIATRTEHPISRSAGGSDAV